MPSTSSGKSRGALHARDKWPENTSASSLQVSTTTTTSSTALTTLWWSPSTSGASTSFTPADFVTKRVVSRLHDRCLNDEECSSVIKFSVCQYRSRRIKLCECDVRNFYYGERDVWKDSDLFKIPNKALSSVCVPGCPPPMRKLGYLVARRTPTALGSHVNVSCGLGYIGEEFQATCLEGGQWSDFHGCNRNASRKVLNKDMMSCRYDSTAYPQGSQISSDDVCYMCSCSTVRKACSWISCNDTDDVDWNIDKGRGMEVDCIYNSTSYPPGANFTAVDGCNTCLCINGHIRCSKIMCDAIHDMRDICIYNSVIYPNGAEFPANDDCNTCVCMNGLATCSKMTCDIINDMLGSCIYNSTIYPHGANFTAQDSCNTCYCIDGYIRCSRMLCEDKHGLMYCVYESIIHQSGARFSTSDGCESCTCYNGSIQCTPVIPCEGLKNCAYNSTTYPSGAEFASSDGCETCACNDGSIHCTPVHVIACEGNRRSDIFDRNQRTGNDTENNGNHVSNSHLKIPFLVIFVVLKLDK